VHVREWRELVYTEKFIRSTRDTSERVQVADVSNEIFVFERNRLHALALPTKL